MRSRSLAAAVGRGLVAGLVGTAAMTLSETLEMKATGREASTVPAQVGAKVFGVEPKNDEQRARLGQAVHWGHGIAWGAARGLLGAAGLRGPAAAGVHFASLWGSDAALYARLGLAPAPWRWSSGELVPDVVHKLVHAGVTSAAYDLLDR